MTEVTRETLDQVKKFARSVQCVLDLAEKAESIDAMKRLEAERAAQLADTNAKLAAASATLEAANGSIKAAEATLAGLNKASEQARADGAAALNDARREAQKVIEDARQQAGAEFDLRMADAKKGQVEVEALIGRLRQEASRLEGVNAVKQATLDELTAQIDKAKAHIAGILRGV